MRQTATTTTTRSNRMDVALAQQYGLPVLLGVNTLVLVALDQLQAIPTWVKMAASAFLAF